MSSLCRWNPDLAEKHKDKGARFSWECAFQALQTGFVMKAFRKYVMTSARGRRNNAPPLLALDESP